MWVPYDCYYHLYSKEDLYYCAAQDDVRWIHAMGDSQEREFVSMFKLVNGSTQSVTKYMQTDFEMYGSPSHLRITWQFFSTTMNGQDRYDKSNGRDFNIDKVYFDHYNLKVSEVCELAECISDVILHCVAIFA